ncbi:MAG: hypothetical protein AB7V27_10205 [Candidatus Binatia bacterium]
MLDLFLATAAAAAPVCPGDCDGDRVVRINEIIQGVAIALGEAPLGNCPSFDRDGDGVVTISELLAGVNGLLLACPAVPTFTPPEGPTRTPTPTPSPTATVNQPPRQPGLVYRTYAGKPVALPLGVDPEGGPVSCTAQNLAANMSVDGAGVLHWSPAPTQIGPFSVDYTCSDAEEPPAVTNGVQHFRVTELDSCTVADCAPERGCIATLVSPAEPCCSGAAIQRAGEPAAECPEGRVLQLGRNREGFGRLYNCDRFPFLTPDQGEGVFRLHIRVRCLNPLNRVRVAVRLEAVRADGQPPALILNSEQQVFVTATQDGFLQRRRIEIPIAVDGPFTDLEDKEANLTVTVTDIPQGNSVTETLRVIMGSGQAAELPDF